MQEYWEMFQSMDTWMQTFWVCAIGGSAIFIIQALLTMIGMDSTDVDVDYRRVGRIVLKELDAQDNRPNEFVELTD